MGSGSVESGSVATGSVSAGSVASGSVAVGSVSSGLVMVAEPEFSGSVAGCVSLGFWVFPVMVSLLELL